VACVCSHWYAREQPDLLSFAAVSDEPPPQVAVAGHDRCIIPIRRENVEAWLRPDRKNLAAQCAILDDRERPTTNTDWRWSHEVVGCHVAVSQKRPLFACL
jgi:putative SOS response-associated peptidase YedK